MFTFCYRSGGGDFNDHSKVFTICQDWPVGSQIERVISTELGWLFITKLVILPGQGLFYQKQLTFRQD